MTDYKKYGITINEYAAIHYWLKKNYGVAVKCENEKCPNKQSRFEWALKKDKKYEYKRENYIQLCRSCHNKYDQSPDFGEKMSKIMKAYEVPREVRKKVSKSLSKPVDQCDLNNNFIRRWESGKVAAETLGISNGGLYECISGKKRQHCGYIWHRPS